MTNVTSNPVLQEIISNVLFCFIQINSHWYISNFIITVIWEIIMCVVDELVVLLKHNVPAQTIALFFAPIMILCLWCLVVIPNIRLLLAPRTSNQKHSKYAASQWLKVDLMNYRKILEYWYPELLKTENADDWESSINVTILNYLETTELLDQTTKY